MPQTGGKDKSSSKRHFTVVIGTKEHGLYCSSNPSSAARKAVSKLCGKEKGKKVEFRLREITQESKKKTYGPYLGHVEKLAKPIQLKGRVIERTPVARLKAKSRVKKGGMWEGGSINDIEISFGNCGRSSRFGFWKNGCITLSCNDKKVVLYYNEETKNIEVRYFINKNNNVYNRELNRYELDKFSITTFDKIISFLDIGTSNDNKIHSTEFLKRCQMLLDDNISNDEKKNIIFNNDNVKLIEKIIKSINNSNFKNTNLIIKETLNHILIKESKDKLSKAIKLCKSFQNLRNKL